MMFASCYRLSPRDAKSLRITDTYSLHRVVYDLFEDVREGSGGSSGILFADLGGDKLGRQVLVLSSRPPRVPVYGSITRTDPLPEAFFGFPAYRFEITINPVVRERQSRKRVPLRTRESIADWFQAKAPSWGFAVQDSSLQVAAVYADCFRKGEQIVTLGKAHLTGILTVLDPARFTESVCQGIGHGKAFGCGLLQVAPLRS